jgi:hypothetical protein
MTYQCTKETPNPRAIHDSMIDEDIQEVRRYRGPQGTMVEVACRYCGKRFPHGPVPDPEEASESPS